MYFRGDEVIKALEKHQNNIEKYLLRLRERCRLPKLLLYIHVAHQVDLSGLTEETCYEVEVVFNPSVASSENSTPSSFTASGSSESASATFTTAPRPAATRAVRGREGGGGGEEGEGGEVFVP